MNQGSNDDSALERLPSSRLCSTCGTSVPFHAAFCSNCGARLDSVAASPGSRSAPPVLFDEAPPDEDRMARHVAEFESRETRRMGIELCNRHVGLLQSYSSQMTAIEKRVLQAERKLKDLGGGEINPERTQSVHEVLEALEQLGDDWEELQLSYNRDSENLDEEFIDRFAELEVDVELPTDLQSRMQSELDGMTATIERIGERVHEVGRLGNRLIARAEGRWFGESGRRRPQAWIGPIVILAWGATLALLVIRGSATPEALLVTSPVAAAGLAILITRFGAR